MDKPKTIVIVHQDHGDVIYKLRNYDRQRLLNLSRQQAIRELEELGYKVAVYPGDVHLIDNLKKHFDSNREPTALVYSMSYGQQGQDSRCQVTAICEMLGLPYLGHPPSTHLITNNKAISKSLARQHGIQTAQSYLATPTTPIPPQWQLPCIVKPNAGTGGSVGIHYVETLAQLQEAISLLYDDYDEPVLVEEFIDGREFRVPVIGWPGQETFVSEPIELVFKEGLNVYSRADKLAKVKTRTESTFNYELPVEIKQQMQHYAQFFHTIANATGATRMDFRVANNQVYFLEANSAPGLGENSPMAQAQYRRGRTLSELREELIERAWQYHAGRRISNLKRKAW